jgi:hypothetical protein
MHHVQPEDSMDLHRQRLHRAAPRPADAPAPMTLDRWSAAILQYRENWAGFLHDPAFRLDDLDDVPWPLAGRFTARAGPEKQRHIALFLRYLAGNGEPVALADPRLRRTLAQEYARWCPDETVTVRCAITMPHSTLRDCFLYMKVVLEDLRAQVESSQAT